MSEFGKHVDFVAELSQQLFINFRVEVLLDCNLQPLVHTFMNCTEPSLWDLLANFKLIELDLQDRVRFKLERLLSVGSVFLYWKLVKLFFQLFYFFLLWFELVLNFYDFAKSFSIVHCLFRIQPWRWLKFRQSNTLDSYYFALSRPKHCLSARLISCAALFDKRGSNFFTNGFPWSVNTCCKDDCYLKIL